jgi:hypothetical protein
MHAAYVRVWFLAGLGALALGALLALATLAGAPLAPSAHAILLAAGVADLALALALGLVPAFARRDWPSPVYALAAVTLQGAALLVPWQERAFAALLGAGLLVGAAQPLALLLSPRWTTPREVEPHRSTDRAALFSLALSLVGIAAGALLLIALPRGVPNAAFAALLLGGALPAAFGALLFVLPRGAREPLRSATLAFAAASALALALVSLLVPLLSPVGATFRWPVAGIALAYALGAATLLRARRGTPLLVSALVLAILAALALLLSTLHGPANALLPVALYAHLAFTLVLVAAALDEAAPLLLPGKTKGRRWTRFAPALLIAALFLYTPALQYGRSAAPAALAAAVGLALLLAGLAPLGSSVPTRLRRR